MKVTRSICSREIKKKDVQDSSGNVVGKISDMTFTFHGKLELSKFILGGSRWEEFLESVKIRPDNDPVFEGKLIKDIDDHVHLDTTTNSLKTTLDKDAISDDEIRLSNMVKMDIVDVDGVKVGQPLAVNFDKDGSVSIIVGGGFVEEKLEAIGIKSDVDIIVPGHVITSIGDKIHLNVSKDSLAMTMDKALKDKELIDAKRMKSLERDVAKVPLYSRRFS
jgi:sporulation protein YlmC with PRC-barrel domain